MIQMSNKDWQPLARPLGEHMNEIKRSFDSVEQDIRNLIISTPTIEEFNQLGDVVGAIDDLNLLKEVLDWDNHVPLISTAGTASINTNWATFSDIINNFIAPEDGYVLLSTNFANIGNRWWEIRTTEGVLVDKWGSGSENKIERIRVKPNERYVITGTTTNNSLHHAVADAFWTVATPSLENPRVFMAFVPIKYEVTPITLNDVRPRPEDPTIIDQIIQSGSWTPRTVVWCNQGWSQWGSHTFIPANTRWHRVGNLVTLTGDFRQVVNQSTWDEWSGTRQASGQFVIDGMPFTPRGTRGHGTLRRRSGSGVVNAIEFEGNRLFILNGLNNGTRVNFSQMGGTTTEFSFEITFEI